MKAFFIVSFLIAQTISAGELADLTFQEFDQSPAHGWRPLAASGRFEEAGMLIDRYITEAEVGAPFRSNLSFHAGQCYAFAGQTSQALSRFRESFQTGGPEEFVPLQKQWNAYVKGTIAFLEGDREELKRCRDEVQNGPAGPMNDTNTKMMDRLLAAFGRTYLEASSGKATEAQPGATDNPDDAQRLREDY